MGAPQDEVKALMAFRKFLILRRPRKRPSRRTHGADPANQGFLPSLFRSTHPSGLRLRRNDEFAAPAQAGGRLAHRGEGQRDQQLVFLADRTDAGLWWPCVAGAAGFLADAGALVHVLVYPDVDEFVERAELASTARRQGVRTAPAPRSPCPTPPAPSGCRPGRRCRCASHTRSRCRNSGYPAAA